MDNKVKVLSKQRRQSFDNHLAMCEQCTRDYQEAKQELEVLNQAMKGEDASLPPPMELAHLESLEFIHETFQKIKERLEREALGK
jgi:hypothetical protein